MIATIDFFTPIVDDPFQYGAIAAANSLSDIYAMGGKPLIALNVSAFPVDLPIEICQEIVRGAAIKVREAGAVIAGGHSIQDKEPKFGLVVIGEAMPDKILTKNGLRLGDELFISKPLGTGTITTALMRGQAKNEHVEGAIASMAMLNRQAAELAVEFGAKGATDITGYGLLGHSQEMASGAKLRLRFHFDDMPFLAGAKEYAAKWIFPGGSHNNRSFFEPHVHFATGISEEERMLLFDAQTSGGLLFGIAPGKAKGLMEEAAAVGQQLWRVGEVMAGEGIEVVL